MEINGCEYKILQCKRAYKHTLTGSTSFGILDSVYAIGRHKTGWGIIETFAEGPEKKLVAVVRFMDDGYIDVASIDNLGLRGIDAKEREAPYIFAGKGLLEQIERLPNERLVRRSGVDKKKQEAPLTPAESISADGRIDINQHPKTYKLNFKL